MQLMKELPYILLAIACLLILVVFIRYISRLKLSKQVLTKESILLGQGKELVVKYHQPFIEENVFTIKYAEGYQVLIENTKLYNGHINIAVTVVNSDGVVVYEASLLNVKAYLIREINTQNTQEYTN